MKKILAIFLLVLLSGCGGDILDRGCSAIEIGFASDTTAILLKHCWEEVETFSEGRYGSITEYRSKDLSLVDVRFNNVYWKSTVSSSAFDASALKSIQWNDSTVLLEERGKERTYSLWKIGNPTPQRISFNWEIDKTEYNGYLARKFRLRPWKNDSVLVFSNFPEFRGHAIIDTKTMDVTAWASEGENAWVTSCDDIWYGKNGGLCLINSKDTLGFSLLSEKGDTLGSFVYPYEVEVDLRGGGSLGYNFVSIFLGGCGYKECNTYPLQRKGGEHSIAMVKYYENGQIIPKPSFWLYSYKKFVDSLGNITEF